MPVTEFATIAHDNDIIQSAPEITTPPSRGRGRGKRRGGGARGGRGSSAAKRPRIEDETALTTIPVNNTPVVVTAPEPPPDAEFVLKFTYGVNAYKHWVMQKNVQLDKTVSTSRGTTAAATQKVKPFKLDVLQCTADELNYSLCLFVKEVRKPNGEEYAPDSIYYLCLGMYNSSHQIVCLGMYNSSHQIVCLGMYNISHEIVCLGIYQ